jgi:hypothetical protein
MQNLIGLLLPPLIDMVNRRITDRDLRFWVSVIICAGVGVGMTAVLTSLWAGLTVQEAVEVTSINIMSIYGLAQLSYGGVWKYSGVRKKMDMDATVRPYMK